MKYLTRYHAGSSFAKKSLFQNGTQGDPFTQQPKQCGWKVYNFQPLQRSPPYLPSSPVENITVIFSHIGRLCSFALGEIPPMGSLCKHCLFCCWWFFRSLCFLSNFEMSSRQNAVATLMVMVSFCLGGDFSPFPGILLVLNPKFFYFGPSVGITGIQGHTQ